MPSEESPAVPDSAGESTPQADPTDVPEFAGSPPLPRRQPAGAGEGRGREAVLQWGLVMLAALTGAVASWIGGELLHQRIAPETREVNLMGRMIETATAETVHAADLRLAVGSFGLFGALLGAALGLAGGLARRRWTGGLGAAVVGLILGAGGGGIAAWAFSPLYRRIVEGGGTELIAGLGVHLALWVPLGAIAGLALGLGLGGRIWPCLLGGVSGVVLGTVLYEFVSAAAFPLDETARPLSASPITRLLALVVVGVSAACGAMMVADHHPPAQEAGTTAP
jgi:hypothetical protein